MGSGRARAGHSGKLLDTGRARAGLAPKFEACAELYY